MTLTPLVLMAFRAGEFPGQPVDRRAMHPGLGRHFDPTISRTSFSDRQSAKRSWSALVACRRLAPYPRSLQPCDRFRAFVPDALAASDALVHANRVAVPRVQKGMGETGKRCTVRTATPPIMGKGVVRKFADFNHGLPPQCASSRKRSALIDCGEAGGNASVCRSLLTSPSGVACALRRDDARR